MDYEDSNSQSRNGITYQLRDGRDGAAKNIKTSKAGDIGASIEKTRSSFRALTLLRRRFRVGLKLVSHCQLSAYCLPTSEVNAPRKH